MEAEWDISAPSAGHGERLRAQRLALSRTLASAAERTMALSGWKGEYPIGAAAWVNTDRSPVLGGPLNCTAIKELAGSAGAEGGANGGPNDVAGGNVGGVGGHGGGHRGHGHHHHHHGGNQQHGHHRGGAFGAAAHGAGGSGAASSSALALSQQTVVSALQNGAIILYNTVNMSKSTLFVPSDVKTTSGGPIGAGGNFYGTGLSASFTTAAGGASTATGQTASSAANNSASSSSSPTGAASSSGPSSSSVATAAVVPVPHTIASSLTYGHLAAVALSPLSYRSDNASRMAMGWIFQDAVAVCTIDAARRDPCVEAVCRLAPIPRGLVASNALIAFSNIFEWGFNTPIVPNTPSTTSSAAGTASSAASSSVAAALASLPLSATQVSETEALKLTPPPRTRLLAAVIAEAETSTSRLMISVQTSAVPSDVGPSPYGTAASSSSSGAAATNTANLFAMQPVRPATAASSSSSSSPWGTLFGEVIFMEWLPNPRPSHMVRRAALSFERETAAAAAFSSSGQNNNNNGGGYYRHNDRRGNNFYGRNNNNRGGGHHHTNNRGGGGYYRNNNNNNWHGNSNNQHNHGNNANSARRYEEYLPAGLQPDGGPSLLLLGTSDCRLIVVQVYVDHYPTAAASAASGAASTAPAGTTNAIPSSSLAWRVVSETLIANDCSTQLMAAFGINRPNYGDPQVVLGLAATMGEAAAVTANSANSGDFFFDSVGLVAPTDDALVGGAAAASSSAASPGAAPTTAASAGASNPNASPQSPAGAATNASTTSSAATAAAPAPPAATVATAAGSPLTAAALTTAVTSGFMVSFVSMGNVLQNAALEVTWPLMTGVVPTAAAVAATAAALSLPVLASGGIIGRKREREGDAASSERESALVVPTTAATESSNASSLPQPLSPSLSSAAALMYPIQHLLHLQPLASLSTDDFYVQALAAGVFGHLPVFIIALATGAIVTVDGRSLAPLHIFNFERSKHSSLARPLALAPREQPAMIAVIDDESLTVIKQLR